MKIRPNDDYIWLPHQKGVKQSQVYEAVRATNQPFPDAVFVTVKGHDLLLKASEYTLIEGDNQ